MKLKKMYADISKTEELDDGTIKVWGFASSEAVDSDGEIIKADAIKAALPDYMQWANVREMHQAKAAGTAIEAEVMADGRTWFGAHVIDSEAVKKVKAGVYKGFSIGGKVTERDNLDKSVITGIKLVEVSLVDRPANPEAVFTMIKAEETSLDPLQLLSKLLYGGRHHKQQARTAPFKKNAANLQNFSSLLASLGWLCSDEQEGFDIEGDASPLPEELRQWLSEGIDIFNNMDPEEAQALLDELQTASGGEDVIEMALRGGGLSKQESTFSPQMRDKLAKAHQAVREAAQHLDESGYDRDEEDEENPDQDQDDEEREDEDKTPPRSKRKPGKSDKEDKDLDEEDHEDRDQAPSSRQQRKKAQRSIPLHKIAQALQQTRGELERLAQERSTLVKRLQALEDSPQNGKAVLRSIAKQDDGASEGSWNGGIPAPVVDHQGSRNDAATLIKFLHQQGGARLL